MDYKVACTNCGETNYHTIGDISFITGRSGIHTCNNCGFQASQFPKMARVEIEMLKKKFARKPEHFFKEERGTSGIYFIVLILIMIAFLGILSFL